MELLQFVIRIVAQHVLTYLNLMHRVKNFQYHKSVHSGPYNDL